LILVEQFFIDLLPHELNSYEFANVPSKNKCSKVYIVIKDVLNNTAKTKTFLSKSKAANYLNISVTTFSRWFKLSVDNPTIIHIVKKKNTKEGDIKIQVSLAPFDN
jgi:hypothetical protein